VARTPAGRQWLGNEGQVEPLLAHASLPSYADAPEGTRRPLDIVVARVTWHRGVLTSAKAAGARFFQRADAAPPCLEPVSR
jgi:hypothetical protein